MFGNVTAVKNFANAITSIKEGEALTLLKYGGSKGSVVKTAAGWIVFVPAKVINI